MLGCKRSRGFELIKTGVLEAAPRYGRRVRVFRDSVARALERGPEVKPRPAKRRRRTKSESFEEQIRAAASHARSKVQIPEQGAR